MTTSESVLGKALDERSATGPRLADPALARIIETLVPLHDRLCPRQVLGARIGLEGGSVLGLALPPGRGDKRLLTFVETDGCFLDGVAAATGCSVGHRTMRIVDHGKIAATFVDTMTGLAFRIWPRNVARSTALAYAERDDGDRWLAQRDGYLRMPTDELLQSRRVQLAASVEALISRPGLRVICAGCGEEVINGRETGIGNTAYCRACAGETYLH